MPNIDDAKPSAIGMFLVGSLAGAYKGRSKKEIAGLALLARLADKARNEYSHARDAAVDEEKEGKMSFEEIIKRDEGQLMFTWAIMNHIENCLNALARIYRLHSLLPTVDQFIENPRSEIRKFRNHIEHMDERVSGVHSGSHSLNISEDALRVELLGEVLKMDDIANEILFLHEKIRGVLAK